ncbi:hypothetical protein KSF78_0008526 [Schistosoma japonicum]|nr:hypothetical protein KSF78_0008526 [Schistosoma japonicum]
MSTIHYAGRQADLLVSMIKRTKFATIKLYLLEICSLNLESQLHQTIKKVICVFIEMYISLTSRKLVEKTMWHLRHIRLTIFRRYLTEKLIDFFYNYNFSIIQCLQIFTDT